jgi:hypothetical protein
MAIVPYYGMRFLKKSLFAVFQGSRNLDTSREFSDCEGIENISGEGVRILAPNCYNEE